ncbi:MAG: GNAT family N-acetyltransferase [Oscillospiraceae bacterium]|nr:GNAT family N-acetyltransferase [Oscillospiraceae bacterium]
MSYQIQKLEPENYDKCNNIWDMSQSPETVKKWYDELVSGNRVIFVYIEDGAYLGEGALVFDTRDTDYTIADKRVYLSRVLTKPECQNRGIGGKIVDALVDYATDLGYKEITVGVDIANVGARWLYEKKGFTTIVFIGEDAGGKYVKLLKTL